MTSAILSLIDSEGREKYLTDSEVTAMLAACGSLRSTQKAFVYTLLYTGARLNEALALRFTDIDLKKKRIAIKTLKQKREKWRHIPVPDDYLKAMDLVFELGRRNDRRKLWDVSDRQARNWIKKIMTEAGMPHHSPHSLRHTFGVRAAMKGIPLSQISKWLGHASMDTTAIYATVMGAQETELNERMWK